MIQAAIDLYHAGDLEGARTQCQALLESDPDNADALHILGMVHNQNGDWEQAYDCVHRAVGLKPDEGMFHNSLGYLWQANNDPEQAVACYREAVRLNPNIVEAQNNLACCLLQQGDVDAARDQFELALRVRPEHPDTLLNLGNLLCETGDAARARELLLKAVELAPENAQIQTAMAWAFLETDSPGFALQCLQNAIKLAPQYSRAHSLLARTHQLLNEPDKALQVLRESLEREPESPVVCTDFGDFYAMQGSPRDARHWYRLSLQKNPGQADVLDKLANVDLQLGAFNEAADSLRVLRENFPKNAEWQLRYGECLGRGGDLRAARDAILKGISLDATQTARGQALLADLHQCAGDFAAAEAYASAALESDPGNLCARLVSIGGALRNGEHHQAYMDCEQVIADSGADGAERTLAGYLKARAADLMQHYQDAAAILSSLPRRSNPKPQDRVNAVLEALGKRRRDIPDEGFPAWPGDFDDAVPTPIFLFGAPGSGVMTLAVALAAHPDLQVLTDRCVGGSRRDDFLSRETSLAALNDLDDAGITAARRNYVEQLPGAGEADGNGTRPCIDILPYNRANPEVIRRYAPGAVVFEVQRATEDILLHGFFGGTTASPSPTKQRELLQAFTDFYASAFARLGVHREVIDGDRMQENLADGVAPLLAAAGVAWNETMQARFTSGLSDNFGLPAFFPRGHASNYQFWLNP